MIKEEWKQLWEFPTYWVSNYGNIVNRHTGKQVVTTRTNHGHVKVSMMDYRVGVRYTRSVAVLVADAFVEVPDKLSDAVIQLDGNHGNVVAWNLAWRPNWFAWRYTHQLKMQQPVEFTSMHVQNVDRGFVYKSIVEASMSEGLLFDDVFRSCCEPEGVRIYPHRCRYKIVERV